MPSLTPNSPIKRLQHVIKQYDGTKNESILPHVIDISLRLLGRDHQANELRDFEMEPTICAAWRGRGVLPPWVHTAELGDLVAWLNRTLPDRHPSEFLIPWIAKELGRIAKEVRRYSEDVDRYGAEALVTAEYLQPRDYTAALDALGRKAPVIAMWAKENRVDINRTTLAEALEAVKDFESETTSVPQGAVVYTYNDGWTVQRLDTDALDAEGDVMQNCICIEAYGADVEGGVAVILSLRDPNGRPHVSMEWRYDRDKLGGASRKTVNLRDQLLAAVGLQDTVDDWRLFPGTDLSEQKFAVEGEGDTEELVSRRRAPNARPISEFGAFEQILGKQNEPPVDKYRLRVQEFIRERFNGDPVALLMVYTPGMEISFRDKYVRSMLFLDTYEELGLGPHDPFFDTDYSGAHFHNCYLDISFDRAVFRGARFTNCEFGMVNPPKPKFEPEVSSDDLATVFEQCDFGGAQLRGGEAQNVHFTDCDWRGSAWVGFTVSGVVVNGGFVDGMTWRNVSGPIRRCDERGTPYPQGGTRPVEPSSVEGVVGEITPLDKRSAATLAGALGD